MTNQVRKMREGRRTGLVPVCAVALLVTVSGCSGQTPENSSGTDSNTTSPSAGNGGAGLAVNEAARSLLPDDMIADGVIEMGTSLSWAPFGYKDENSDATGIDIGLIEAIGDTLGLDVEITDVEFQSMVPGVTNGRFDVAMNQLEDTEERREVVQFVHYYQDAIGVLTQQDTEIDPEDLCGRAIAATQGSSQVQVLERVDAACKSEGEPGITMKTFPDSAATILAVQSNRVESMLMGTATAKYLVDSEADSNLKVVDGYVPDTEALTGIVVAKDNDDLAAALQAALQGLVDNGWYEEYLAQYGVADRIPEEITIGKG